MEVSAAPPFSTGLVTSSDGTPIGYRQMGRGPGLVLVPGGMQAARNFMKLGSLLADEFTVTIVNRRGRRPSGPFRPDHRIQAEVDDLDAVLQATGARDVFALSAGALVSLQAALCLPALRRLALYEPPLALAGDASATAWGPPYEAAMSRGDLAGAMVACMKGTGDRGDVFNALPRFLMIPLMRLALALDRKRVGADEASLESLVRCLRGDLSDVNEMAGTLANFRAVDAEVLLIGGSLSAHYLTAALDALASVLPQARRVVLPGVGHLAADDTGRPDCVAKALRAFFAATRDMPQDLG